jgi:argininosuccinate lyase
VPRFDTPQDPLFRRINSSLGFDRRLWPQDIRGSLAHARALERAGVLDEGELRALTDGLEHVAGELERDEFSFEEHDEDIHMAIERRLTELVGPLGGKLHTGRSRNDQVATDVALYVRERSERAVELLTALMSTLADVAEQHADWPMPGYTHLQRAQPVYLGHHLLAYFWMLRRDARRFVAARDAARGEMPLGSGALAGLNWELDRVGTAAELGFTDPAPNSIDAVASRDAVLDYLSAAAICATHLSRLGSELVLWSSQEFGFSEPADDFSSGSSIMPQKKNPDAAELLRGKAPRVAASLQTLLGVLHALPLAYSKDLQEDKEALFDAVDTVETCLEAAERMLAGTRFDRAALAAAAADEFLAATDLADLLVRKGMPFREAHGVVGGLVREALQSGRALSDLTEDELRSHSDLLDAEYYEVLAGDAWIESKLSAGGSASARVAEQLAAARAALARLAG